MKKVDKDSAVVAWEREDYINQLKDVKGEIGLTSKKKLELFDKSNYFLQGTWEQWMDCW